MQIKPIYMFDDTNDTGINKVPDNAMVMIKDSDGAGTLKQILKISNTNLDDNSTISDFLNDSNLFSEMPTGSTGDIIGGTY